MAKNIKRPNKTQERCDFLIKRTGCTLTDAFEALNIFKDNLSESQIYLEKIIRRRMNHGKESNGLK